MNTPNIKKLSDGLNLCLELSGELQYAKSTVENVSMIVASGFDFALKLMDAAMRTKDLVLFEDTYAKANNLLPDERLIDSVVYNNLKKRKLKFQKDLVVLIKQHPSFLVRTKIPQLHNLHDNTNNVKLQKEINNRIKIICEKVFAPHMRGFKYTGRE